MATRWRARGHASASLARDVPRESAFVDDYMHAVEFFDLVLQLGLSAQEKSDLVAYMLCL